MNKLIEIAKILKTYEGKQVIFSEPIPVGLPHNDYLVYGVSQSMAGIGVMDGAGNWHGPLLSARANSAKIIHAIHERLTKA